MSSNVERFIKNFTMYFDLMTYYLQEARNVNIPCLTPELFQLAKTFVNMKTPEQVVEIFIRQTYKCWEQMYHKDEKFFIENAKTLFPVFSDEQVNSFCILFTAQHKGKSFLSEEDKESIWKYIHSFIRIALRHIHQKREPASKVENGETLKGYRNKYLPEIDLSNEAKRWEVELTF